MKKTVCVIFGGASSEYEVSLMSSASIIRNLDTEKFDILTLGITKDGRWLLYSGAVENIENNTWMNSETARPAFISPDKATNGLVVLNADGSYTVLKVDVLFPVLHGKNGEDSSRLGQSLRAVLWNRLKAAKAALHTASMHCAKARHPGSGAAHGSAYIRRPITLRKLASSSTL